MARQHWEGVRTVAVQTPSTATVLEQIRANIAAGRSLTDDELRRVESVLFRILKDKKLIAALDSQGKGRKSGSLAFEIALHYLVRKEQLGKAAAAAADVAITWQTTEKTVKDAFTDYGRDAQYQLKMEAEKFVHRDAETTREKILSECNAELRHLAKLNLSRKK